MGQFFKFFFASCLGTIIGLFLLVLLLVGIGSTFTSGLTENEKEDVQANSVLKLNLDYAIPQRTSKNPFSNFSFPSMEPNRKLGLNDIVANIEKAAKDDNIKGIYLKMDAMPNSLATIKAIRKELKTFKDSGKFIISYGEILSQKAYYLASVANNVYLNPKGMMQLNGFNSSVTFFKNTLDKLDIEAQVFYAGKFKSATEPFRREDMSEANKKQLRVYLNDIYNQMLHAVSEGRDKPVSELDSIINNLVVRHPYAAKNNGIVDDLLYEDQVFGKVRDKVGIEEDSEINFVANKKYKNVPGKDNIKGIVDDKIAVLYSSGSIVGGEGEQNQIGSKRFAEAIRNIREKDDNKALVLRINSPGGSALASEVIWRELQLTKEQMPVIVSMGGVAASGGYYLASAGDTILAESNTVTGSIGVFGMWPNMKGFFNDKLGVTFDGVKTSRFADFGQVHRPLRPEEKEIIQSGIDTVYRSFKERVAEGRNLSMDSVESLAQGRIYAGTQAKENGLVDEIGGMDRATAIAQEKAKIDKYRLRSYPEQKDPFQKIMEELKGGIYSMWMEQKLGNYFEQYERLEHLREMTGVQARMPYRIKVN
jgi:protease-4